VCALIPMNAHTHTLEFFYVIDFLFLILLIDLFKKYFRKLNLLATPAMRGVIVIWPPKGSDLEILFGMIY
jgi:hypothetical protein